MRMKRGLAGLASVGAVLVVGAFVPSAAMAHPCLSEVESAGTSLTLHTGGNWAGYMPSFSDLSHECADDLNSYIYQSTAQTEDEPVPGVPAGPTVSAAGFAIKNLTALGYSARQRRLQLGPGVQGQLRLRRHVRGLPRHRRHQQDDADADPQLHGLQRRPGRRHRLRQHPDPLVGRAGQRQLDLRGPGRRHGLRRHPHLRHLRPGEPRDEEAAPHGLDRQ
jgi:hypothetical protein